MSRRSWNRTKKVLIFTLIIIAAVGQKYGWFDTASQQIIAAQPGLYSVTEFLDGDTLIIDMNGHAETVRFIGVDTPETHDPRKAVQCFGEVAATYTRTLIGSQQIRLAADPLDTNRDRYDRLLRYVYLPDGTLLNAKLIEQGFGFAYLGFPFSKSDEFQQLQTDAMQAQRGLWDSCKPTANDFGGYTSNDATQR